jgi:hypothetical protein
VCGVVRGDIDSRKYRVNAQAVADFKPASNSIVSDQARMSMNALVAQRVSAPRRISRTSGIAIDQRQ